MVQGRTLVVSRHFRREIWLTIIVALVVEVVVFKAYSHVQDLFFQIVVHVAVLIVVAGVLFGISMARVWPTINVALRSLDAIQRDAEGFERPFLEFTKHKLGQIVVMVAQAFSSSGVRLSIEDVDQLSLFCFQFASGNYYGVDSSLPSVFSNTYPRYLDYHAEAVKRSGAQSVRILLVDVTSLETDWQEHREDFLEFQRWHLRNNIDLLVADPARAVVLADRHHLPSSAKEVAIWGTQLVGFFRPEGDRIHITLCGDNSVEAGAGRRYFRELIRSAQSLDTTSGWPELREVSGYVLPDF